METIMDAIGSMPSLSRKDLEWAYSDVWRYFTTTNNGDIFEVNTIVV